MKIDKLLMGVLKKEDVLEKICKNYNIKSSEVCYIGDDINDLGLLKLVGFSATPSDGILEAQKICDYVCKNKGGRGVFREIADMILFSQKVKL